MTVTELSRDELTVLTIGASDSCEGPYFVMPTGGYVYVKAEHLVWMARRIRELEMYEPSPDPREEQP